MFYKPERVSIPKFIFVDEISCSNTVPNFKSKELMVGEIPSSTYNVVENRSTYEGLRIQRLEALEYKEITLNAHIC